MTSREDGSAPEENALLLQQCLQGDAQAWSWFCDRFTGVIYGAVQRVVRARVGLSPTADTDDIAQDVFVRLLRDEMRLLRTYDPARASLATWLTIIARSVTLDHLKQKRLKTLPLEEARHAAASNTPQPMSRGPAPSLKEVGAHLSPRQKLILHMLYDQDLTVSEVSRILGLREQTIRSTKHKAVKKLRDFYRPDGDV